MADRLSLFLRKEPRFSYCRARDATELVFYLVRFSFLFSLELLWKKWIGEKEKCSGHKGVNQTKDCPISYVGRTNHETFAVLSLSLSYVSVPKNKRGERVLDPILPPRPLVSVWVCVCAMCPQTNVYKKGPTFLTHPGNHGSYRKPLAPTVNPSSLSFGMTHPSLITPFHGTKKIVKPR